LFTKPDTTCWAMLQFLRQACMAVGEERGHRPSKDSYCLYSRSRPVQNKPGGKAMNLIETIAADSQAIVALRRDIHAHPELRFEEVRTTDVIARTLTHWGIQNAADCPRGADYRRHTVRQLLAGPVPQ